MAGDDLQFGIIGLGWVGQKHLNTLGDLEGVSVTAVCDVDEEKAVNAAKKYGAADYSDFDEMLSAEQLSGVFITTPPDTHIDLLDQSLSAGVNTFVEKPVTTEYRRGLELRRKFDTDHIFVQVGFHYRYDELVDVVRSYLKDVSLSSLDAHYIGHLPGVEWWHDRDRSGGQVIEQGSHVLDLVRYVAGPVETVQAVSSRKVHTEPIDFPDTTAATLKHSSGTVTSVTSTCSSPEDDVRVRFTGNGVHLNLDLRDGRLTGQVNGESIDRRRSESPYRREVQAFVDAVRSNSSEPIRTSLQDGLESVKLASAIVSASESETTTSVESFDDV